MSVREMSTAKYVIRGVIGGMGALVIGAIANVLWVTHDLPVNESIDIVGLYEHYLTRPLPSVIVISLFAIGFYLGTNKGFHRK